MPIVPRIDVPQVGATPGPAVRFDAPQAQNYAAKQAVQTGHAVEEAAADVGEETEEAAEGFDDEADQGAEGMAQPFEEVLDQGMNTRSAAKSCRAACHSRCPLRSEGRR